MEVFAHPWQLALTGFIVGFLLARWLYYRRESLPPPLRTDISDADIEAALRAKHKVDAIRLYRQRTDVDLKDALQAVDAMANRIGAA